MVEDARDGRRHAEDATDIQIGQLAAFQKLRIAGVEGQRLEVDPAIEDVDAGRCGSRGDLVGFAN